MNKSELKRLIEETIKNIILIKENVDDKNPLYVEYEKDMTGEDPFVMQGGKKFQYVWAKYPNGKVDIGVYAFQGDVVYGYQAFRNMYNLTENTSMKKSQLKQLIKECLREMSQFGQSYASFTIQRPNPADSESDIDIQLRLTGKVTSNPYPVSGDVSGNASEVDLFSAKDQSGKEWLEFLSEEEIEMAKNALADSN